MSSPFWSELPSLNALRAFTATAQTGGFTAAAEALSVTPAAVAQQVRALETTLGVALVRRDGRGLALTEQGETLADRLSAAFEAMGSAVADLGAAEARRGLRVSLPPDLADEFLIPRMGDFWRRHPGIEAALFPSPADIDLAHSSFDLGIRVGDGNFPGLTATLLTETRWIAVGDPEIMGKRQLRTVGRMPWLFVRNLPQPKEIARQIGLNTDRPGQRDLGNLRQLLEAVREGRGVAILTEFIVREDVAAGRLRAAELPGMGEAGYWAVTPPGPRRAAVETFIGWLRTRLQKEAGSPVARGAEIPA